MTTDDRILPLLESDVRVLADASLVIHSVQNRNDLMLMATNVITEMLGAEGSNIALRDPETGELVFYAGAGEKYSRLLNFRLAEGEGVTGHCVKTSTPLIVNDTRNDPRFCSRADEISGFRTRNILCVPLLLGTECIGSLSVVNKKEGGFENRDRFLCEVIAGQIAGAIRNVQVSRAAVEAAKLAAIGQAVAGVAHCMKNLLYGLQGGLYVIKKDLDRAGVDPQRRGLEMVERNYGRLVELVQDMLAYAKDRKPQYADTDLGELIRSVVDLMRDAAWKRKVRLLAEPVEDQGTVELDPGSMQRCLLNLVSNGVDACEEDGAAVRVSARSAGPDWAVIEVRDEGCGMDENARRHLFQPFFSSKGSRGTGLGLSVTRKIVQEHGGRIEVESEEGKGSTFRILLPRRRPA